MAEDRIANATISIRLPIAEVWNALVDPAMIKQYMFGTEVVSTWAEGSPIVWQGEWQGKPYADKGVIVQFHPPDTLQYSHFSPLAGLADVPENYHTVTIELSSRGSQTQVSLPQDKNPSEAARRHSEDLWRKMLEALKALLETQRP